MAKVKESSPATWLIFGIAVTVVGIIMIIATRSKPNIFGIIPFVIVAFYSFRKYAELRK